jgi:hypothetical protein
MKAFTGREADQLLKQAFKGSWTSLPYLKELDLMDFGVVV